MTHQNPLERFELPQHLKQDIEKTPYLGPEWTSALEMAVDERRISTEKAEHIGNSVSTLSEKLYDFFEPIAGSIEGFIDLYRHGADLSEFSGCDILDGPFHSYDDASYLVCGQVTSLIANSNPELFDENGDVVDQNRYIGKLEELSGRGIIELKPLTADRVMIMSREDEGRSLMGQVYRRLSPDRVDELNDLEARTEGDMSANYRNLPRVASVTSEGEMIVYNRDETFDGLPEDFSTSQY